MQFVFMHILCQPCCSISLAQDLSTYTFLNILQIYCHHTSIFLGVENLVVQLLSQWENLITSTPGSSFH